MKNQISFCFLLISLNVFGQDTSGVYRLDEIHLSINRTLLSNYNTNDNYGYGAAVYFFNSKPVQVKLGLGIELNQVKLHKDFQITNGHFGTGYKKIDYDITYLSLPIILKFQAPEFPISWKVGIGIDPVLESKMTAIEHTIVRWDTTYVTDSLGTHAYEYPVYEDIKVSKDAEIKPVFNILLGANYRLPFQKFSLIVGIDCRMGAKQDYGYDKVNFNRYIRGYIGIQRK